MTKPYICLYCNTVWEDEIAERHWETLAGIDRCINCASVEEMMECGYEEIQV